MNLLRIKNVDTGKFYAGYDKEKRTEVWVENERDAWKFRDTVQPSEMIIRFNLKAEVYRVNVWMIAGVSAPKFMLCRKEGNDFYWSDVDQPAVFFHSKAAMKCLSSISDHGRMGQVKSLDDYEEAGDYGMFKRITEPNAVRTIANDVFIVSDDEAK